MELKIDHISGFREGEEKEQEDYFVVFAEVANR